MNLYAHEKTRELESELKNRLHIEPPTPRKRPIIGGIAAGAGHVLRRVGEGLESWSAGPPAASEGTSLTRHQVR